MDRAEVSTNAKMAQEDQAMQQWFDILKLMHQCARHLNRETRPKLAAFYRQKHTQVLTTEAQRSHFRSCFLSRAQTAGAPGADLRDDDFKSSQTFGELLSLSSGKLRTRVRALLRRVAIEVGTVPAAVAPEDFQEMHTVEVFATEPQRDALCARLAASMPIFPSAIAEQDRFRRLLRDDDTTVGEAVASVL
jgi:hypothetical protein